MRRAALLPLALALWACPTTRDGPPPRLVEVPLESPGRLDLLFVVDDSNSMAEEQAVLTTAVEPFLRELLEPATADGEKRPAAVRDLRVGVVSTDMGTGGYTIMTCDEPMEGEAGRLHAEGMLEGCEPSYGEPGCEGGPCPWLASSEAAPDDGRDAGDPPIWEDFGCIASLGVDGCGFEQPLEASLVALTVRAAPGGANEGFLRRDSVLAVVFVTDEDDCSARNGALFDPTRDDLGPLCVRCMLAESLLFTRDRYLEGLRGLRPGGDELVVAAAIAGVPPDLETSPALWAADARACDRLDPANPNTELPSCETDLGIAKAPVRIVELVTAFGQDGVVGSICRPDWSDTFEAIARAVQRRLELACLAPPEPVRLRRCRLVGALEGDGPCPPALEGEGGAADFVDLGLDAAGRRLCEIPAADGDGDGAPDGPGPCPGCPLGQPGCEALGTACAQGFYVTRGAGPCPAGQARMTSPAAAEPFASLRLECPADE